MEQAMSLDDRTAEDAAKWKQKYLDALERQEIAQQTREERLTLLRRGITRVSAAAYGLDPELDQQLDQLRESVRQQGADVQLAAVLEDVEASVLRLDSRKSQGAEIVLASFRQLLAQLQGLALPAELKSQLSRFGKGLKSRTARPQQYAALLAEYSGLQAAALEARIAERDAAPGLLQRLLRRPEQPSAPDERPQPQAFDRIAGEVAERLRSLVGQLELPESMREERVRLDEQLSRGVDCDTLLGVLEAVAAVILAAAGREQQEFETFLQTLNDRLGEIRGFLHTTHSDRRSARQDSQALEGTMRSQIDSIKTSVRDAQDLEQLKLAVHSQVEGILSSMDALRAEEQRREQQLGAQLERLVSRMESMEAESRHFRQHLEQQRADALRDVLTALPNRRAYEERIKAEVARVKRYGGKLSLAVADIDHFKRVNDNYGHLAGDKVLKVTAKTLVKSLREADFVARYGGEEFVLLMPDTDLDQARHVVEKLRRAVEACRFHYQAAQVPITLSFGVAQFSEADSAESLFARADRALYQAKSEGRNRFCMGAAEA
jgi:diguanylate cyclase